MCVYVVNQSFFFFLLLLCFALGEWSLPLNIQRPHLIKLITTLNLGMTLQNNLKESCSNVLNNIFR